MDSLNPNYIKEKSKLASGGAWLWLLEIATTGYSTLRYTSDNAAVDPTHFNLTWNGEIYYTMPFTMDDIEFSTSGKFPEYKLQLDDADIGGSLRARVQATSGLVGSTVRLMVVHSDHLDLTTPAIDELAEVLGCEVTANSVILTIGIPSLLSRRFPRDRYVSGFCRHKFAGALCQYVQPAYSITGTDISFIAGIPGESGIQYNIIQKLGEGLITSVFSGAPGAYSGLEYALTKDTGFTVSGSLNNDGFFLANNYHAVNQKYVRVFMEDDGARPFEVESPGQNITITLGYNQCDHSLEACELRDNTQNYGGSPGIAGGMYG